ncbi:MAG: universal stress protein [Bacillota bacterium]|nr:universal stress protein [Bacillota bacterium]MDW7677386.1 universal stress protein [Bacillota bacterium]
MKLLVCVDGSKESDKALDKTVEFTAGCRVDKVTLMMVFKKVTFPYVESVETSDPEIMESFNLMNEELMRQHEKILEESAEKLRKKGIEPELLMKEGRPAPTISQVAEKEKYDMIIIGGRGRSGEKTSTLGSVSNAVIQTANVSVLVVK